MILDPKPLLLIALGGGLGSVCRVLFSGFITSKAGSPFPWGILAVNVLGSFAIGLVAGWASRANPTAAGLARNILILGFLGGFTTFSTFSHQTLDLLQRGLYIQAAAYALGSVAAGLAAVAVADSLARP